jgi:hypothetical protein
MKKQFYFTIHQNCSQNVFFDFLLHFICLFFAHGVSLCACLSVFRAALYCPPPPQFSSKCLFLIFICVPRCSLLPTPTPNSPPRLCVHFCVPRCSLLPMVSVCVLACLCSALLFIAHPHPNSPPNVCF